MYLTLSTSEREGSEEKGCRFLGLFRDGEQQSYKTYCRPSCLFIAPGAFPSDTRETETELILAPASIFLSQKHQYNGREIRIGLPGAFLALLPSP